MQTPRMISVKNFPKKSVDKNPLTTTQDVFKIIYHASLAGGVILCMCYFTIYADGLPALGDIAQLLGLLIATCSITFTMICFFAIVLVLPSILAFAFPQEEALIKPLQLFSFFANCILIALWFYYEMIVGNKLYVTGFIVTLIGISIYLLCCYSHKYKDNMIFAGWSILLVAVSFFLSSVCAHKGWLLSAFIFPLIYQIIHRKDEHKEFWKHGVYFGLYLLWIMVYGWTISLVYTLLNIESTDDKGLNISLVVLLFLIVQVANIFVLQKGKKLKDIFSIAFFSFLITIFLFTLVSQVLSRPNPLVVAPFANLKLGYYPAELRFKGEFIKDTNFFNMKDRNITSNVFFILNSIGDEYIVRERSPILFVDDNMSLSAIDYNNTIYWYDKKDNNETAYKFKDFHFQPADEVNASTLKETSNKDKTKKYTNTQVYRIKKSDVIYETNGKGFDNRNTTVYGR